MKRSSFCRTAVVFDKEEAITAMYGPAGKEYNIPRRGTFFIAMKINAIIVSPFHDGKRIIIIKLVNKVCVSHTIIQHVVLF